MSPKGPFLPCAEKSNKREDKIPSEISVKIPEGTKSEVRVKWDVAVGPEFPGKSLRVSFPTLWGWLFHQVCLHLRDMMACRHTPCLAIWSGYCELRSSSPGQKKGKLNGYPQSCFTNLSLETERNSSDLNRDCRPPAQGSWSGQQLCPFMLRFWFSSLMSLRKQSLCCSYMAPFPPDTTATETCNPAHGEPVKERCNLS